MIRRLAYAALIVFMPHMPQIATMLLLAVCFVSLAFTIVEKPWSSTEMNKLAIANETLLCVLLVLIMVSPILIEETERHILGWLIIAVVTLTIHVNLSVIIAEAWLHCRLLYTRRQNRKTKQVSSKVVPRSTTLEMAQIESGNRVQEEQ